MDRLTRRELRFAAGAAAIAAHCLVELRERRYEDFTVYRTVGSARARPDLHDRVHHAHHGYMVFGTLVCDRRRIRAAPTDGRRVQRIARQAHLPVPIASRARLS